jgi:hypothetical protein
VVLWQESSGVGQEEESKLSREFRPMFMLELPARTDWEAPKAEKAYLDNERREGMVSDTDSRTDD